MSKVDKSVFTGKVFDQTIAFVHTLLDQDCAVHDIIKMFVVLSGSMVMSYHVDPSFKRELMEELHNLLESGLEIAANALDKHQNHKKEEGNE